MCDGHRSSWILEHRLLLAGVVVYFALLAVVGFAIHPIEVPGGEYDLYAWRAEQLLKGNLPGDGFHPFLYPELVACTTLLVGDAFAAGRLVSNLAAGLLLYSSYRLTRQCFGRVPAVWAMLLLAANVAVLLLGIQAATDMTSAAFVTTGLWLLVAARGSRWRQGAAGLFLGLAAATRLSALPLIPVFGCLLLCGPYGAARGRLRSAGTLLLGAVVGCLPHAIPNTLQFGSPFANQSWRNLALKASGNWNERDLYDTPYAGLLDLLGEKWWPLLREGVTDWVGVWTGGLGSFLAGNPASSPVAPVMTGLVLAGCVWHAVREPRRALPFLLMLGAYSLLVAFTFKPIPRLLLPMAPPALALSTGLVFDLSRRRPGIGHAACGLLCVGVLIAAAGGFERFGDKHPLPEVAAARQVAHREGPSVGLLSFYPPLFRHVQGRVSYVPQPPRDRRSPRDLLVNVLQTSAKTGADYLVVGPRTCPPLDTATIARHAPAGSGIVRLDENVLVLRLPREEREWLAKAEAILDADGEQVLLRLDTLPVPDLIAAGFTAFPPSGPPILVPLDRISRSAFGKKLPAEPWEEASWRLVPTCLLATGQVHKGPAVLLVIR